MSNETNPELQNYLNHGAPRELNYDELASTDWFVLSPCQEIISILKMSRLGLSIVNSSDPPGHVVIGAPFGQLGEVVEADGGGGPLVGAEPEQAMSALPQL
jgi:hypothetical protein